MADVITFDGTELPCPSTQSYEGQQLVDSAREMQKARLLHKK